MRLSLFFNDLLIKRKIAMALAKVNLQPDGVHGLPFCDFCSRPLFSEGRKEKYMSKQFSLFLFESIRYLSAAASTFTHM